MREKLLPTQEVGSLMQAPFLKKDVNEDVIKETIYWGRLLDVARLDDLISMLRRRSLTRGELHEWASIFGLRFFESAGLDVVWDGEQRRVEMYEYPISHLEGFRFVGRVKVWDLETYNKAAVVAPPSLRKYLHLDEFEFAKRYANRELKVPVTGPYTLADWSFDEYYVRKYSWVEDFYERGRLAKRDFVLDVAENVVRPVVMRLSEAGARRIQIDEPAATTKPDEVELFVEAFNRVASGIDALFTIHVCYSDYSKLFPYILEAKAAQISIECANRDTPRRGMDGDARRGYEVLRLFKEYDAKMQVAVGVIDVHTDFVEAPTLVRDRLLYSVKILDDPSLVVACNDCGLRTRRWEVAYKKEVSLVEGARLAREELLK